MLCGERAYFVLVKESLRCWGVLRGRVAQGGRFRWPAIENSMGAYCQGSRNEKVDGHWVINLPGAEGTSGPAMPRCAKAPVVCWRGSGELGRAVGEKALVVGEEGRKTESSPQVREVSGRSIGEF